MECILEDMNQFRLASSDGFVFGALTSENEIDIPKSELIIKHSNGLPVTYHRAFDLTDKSNLKQNSLILEEIGFKRLLTSGFEQSAFEGIENIKLINESVKSLIVIPGAGININNANEILQRTNCKEFHSTARAPTVQTTKCGKLDFGTVIQSNSNVVRTLVDIGKTYF